MRKTIAMVLAAVMLVLASASLAFGKMPNGLKGYEGQPGHQGGGGGQPQGLLGYEGQPGNQGGH